MVLTTVVLNEAQLREIDGHLHVDPVEPGEERPQLLTHILHQSLVLYNLRRVGVTHPQLNARRYHSWNGQGKPDEQIINSLIEMVGVNLTQTTKSFMETMKANLAQI